MRTKLTKAMREKIIKHVHNTVESPATKKPLDKARFRLTAQVVKFLKKKFIPEDMTILRHYGLAEQLDCIRLYAIHEEFSSRASRVDLLFSMPGQEKGPSVDQIWVPSYNFDNSIGEGEHPIPETAQIFQAFEIFKAALAEHEKAMKEIFTAFKKVVNEAKTVEELTEVWPEAAKILNMDECSADLEKEQAVDIVRKTLGVK